MLGYLFLTIIGLSLVAFYVGRASGNRFAATDIAATHSLPGYHGAFVAIWVGIPALALVLMWLLFQDSVIDGLLLRSLPDAMTQGLSQADRALLLSEIHNVAAGQVFSEPSPEVEDAAGRYARWSSLAGIALFVVAVSVMMAGLSSDSRGSRCASGRVTTSSARSRFS